MQKGRDNHCIECSVVSCRNHSETGNFCALEKIRVGTHETDPNVDQCTDCQSFQMR